MEIVFKLYAILKETEIVFCLVSMPLHVLVFSLGSFWKLYTFLFLS